MIKRLWFKSRWILWDALLSERRIVAFTRSNKVCSRRSFWIQPYISVPALELLSRAVPSVGGYHHRSVGPTTGRNPGGRQKKNTMSEIEEQKTCLLETRRCFVTKWLLLAVAGSVQHIELSNNPPPPHSGPKGSNLCKNIHVTEQVRKLYRTSSMPSLFSVCFKC